MNKKDKESRKQYVKEQRQRLKKDPTKFIKEVIIVPTLTYWKQRPVHAFFTFSIWLILYGLIFGGIQAINNDMIYCTSPIPEFNGKIMFNYNRFVAYYNNAVEEFNLKNSHLYTTENRILMNNKIKDFYNQTSIFCNYNLKRWNNETILYRLNSTSQGFMKIVTKGK